MKEVILFLLAVPIVLLSVAHARLEVMSVPDKLHASLVIPTAAVPVPTAFPTTGPLSGAEAIIAVARTWLNPPVPYLWGGCTRRGVDCSCLMVNIYRVFGVNMPRTTSQQIRWAIPVSRDQMAPGDLAFFNNTCDDCGPNPTHVGLYIGGGMMIHAGDPVQISPINRMQFGGAGRPR